MKRTLTICYKWFFNWRGKRKCARRLWVRGQHLLLPLCVHRFWHLICWEIICTEMPAKAGSTRAFLPVTARSQPPKCHSIASCFLKWLTWPFTLWRNKGWVWFYLGSRCLAASLVRVIHDMYCFIANVHSPESSDMEKRNVLLWNA